MQLAGSGESNGQDDPDHELVRQPAGFLPAKPGGVESLQEHRPRDNLLKTVQAIHDGGGVVGRLPAASMPHHVTAFLRTWEFGDSKLP